MPNRSKVNDPRFWAVWRASGAVAKQAKTPVNKPIVVPDYLLILAKKAFALAINEYLPYLRPLAEDVVVEPGILYHQCKWSNGDGLGERFEISGSFYHRDFQPDNQGSVCITTVLSDSCSAGFPHSWHHLFFVDVEYEQMINALVETINDETCPLCFMIGRVAENHIGGGAEFGGDCNYCYNCCSTF